MSREDRYKNRYQSEIIRALEMSMKPATADVEEGGRGSASKKRKTPTPSFTPGTQDDVGPSEPKTKRRQRKANMEAAEGVRNVEKHKALPKTAASKARGNKLQTVSFVCCIRCCICLQQTLLCKCCKHVLLVCSIHYFPSCCIHNCSIQT
jgi:hypothetical protein